MIEYTAAYWATTNPVLPLGEFGLDTTNGTLKLGNGESKWLDLSYIQSNTQWGKITGTLSNQTDLENVINPLSPLTNQTYTGQVNLSTNYEVYYNSYSTNVAETPTISITPLVGAVARLLFVTGASGSLITTNLGTLRAGSDTYTVSKTNEILVFSLPEGLEYSIKVLN